MSQLRRRLARIAPALALIVAACAGSGNDTGTSRVEPAVAGGGSSPVAALGQGADPAPAQLVGLDADQLERLLGPADFKRSDGPAELLQYRDTECIIDLFLYPDAASGAYRVTHVDARDRILNGGAEQTCVSRLLRARRLHTAGSM
ncbi:MAG: hypothetical protein IPK78_14080 [Rhodospirillales bacterium]|nr:hypothetical protein [Rhodospirillales bacterium]